MIGTFADATMMFTRSVTYQMFPSWRSARTVRTPNGTKTSAPTARRPRMKRRSLESMFALISAKTIIPISVVKAKRA